ncbi:hypothetical protein [Dulcicalothrix desertica]|nr:hypothetical protein [Dulcicalothrix desertica]TWH53661.1 hypothetical protein CAL7102_01636 [Dulcicalothrix desertica PCC 7102]
MTRAVSTHQVRKQVSPMQDKLLANWHSLPVEETGMSHCRTVM